MNKPSNPLVVCAASNTRDLGGIRLADGRTLAHGVLFRGGHMAELSAVDDAAIRALGLEMIIDLRRPDEIAQRPTPALANRFHAVSVSPADNDFAVVAANLTDPAIAATALQRARGYYRGIVSNLLHLYRPVFDSIVDAENHPLLFHCTAGKDRTGFTAAAILGMLGASLDDIVADYLYTNTLRGTDADARIEDYRTALGEQMGVDAAEVGQVHLDALRAVMLVDASYIRATFAAVDDEYGSWDSLRADGLGIDDARFEAFRDAVSV